MPKKNPVSSSLVGSWNSLFGAAFALERTSCFSAWALVKVLGGSWVVYKGSFKGFRD